MRKREQLHQAQLALIDAIYAAATDQTRWADVTRAATSLIGGGISSLVHRRGTRLLDQRLLSTELDPAFARSYEEHYGAINPWVVHQRQDRPLLEAHESMLDSPRQLEHTEFYADFLRPQDLRYSFDACVPLSHGETVELASVRSRKIGPYDEAEYQALLGVLPHLKRAVEIARRLELAERAREAGARAAGQLGSGIIVVDCERRVMTADDEAERHLRAPGGLSLREGRLRSAVLDAALGQAIAKATGSGRKVDGRSGGLILIPGGEGRPALSVAIAPLDERSRPQGLPGPLATVLVSVPEHAAPPSRAGLQTLYNLTAAEARLAAALCAGESLSEHANATGTSQNTAKTHLKHIFEKTGETRQAGLVRRIMGDLALRYGTEEP